MAMFRKPRGGIRGVFSNISYSFHDNNNEKEFQDRETQSKNILCEFLCTYWPS